MGLRDKFKPVKIATLNSKVAAEDKVIGAGGRAGFLSIDDGYNKFRIFPVHPGGKEDDMFYAMKTVHWVSLEGDGGQMKRFPVLNARVHGNFKRDLFEEYMKGANKWMTENEVDDAADKVKAMTDWKGGISASNSWLCYANKVEGDKKEFGILEFGKLIRDGLNKIAAFEDSDEPIEVDPFTDPDEGILVIIRSVPKASRPADKYEVSTGRKPQVAKLTDEELEDFSKVKPLRELYQGVYGTTDFEKALEGIRNFDEEHEIGFCDTDEFNTLVEEMQAEVEAGATKKAKDSKVKAAPSKPTAKRREVEETEEEAEEEAEEAADEEEEAAEGDEFDGLDRSALKKYIAKHELDVKVKTSMTDDDIRNAIREAISTTEEEEPAEEETEEEEEAAPVKKKAVKKPVEDDEEEGGDDEDEEAPSLEEIKARLKKKAGK